MTGGSGDLLADRRLAWAKAALGEGDAEAAADLARQALEIAPGFAAAWFLLGEACEALYAARQRAPDALGLYHEAVGAFEQARAADPEDRLGAGLLLARLSVGDPLDAMAPGYVRALFDDYAVRFDRHLVQSLNYRAPALLHDAVRRAASRLMRQFRFDTALDLGCGTGLAGEAFRPVCGALAGIDLSPAMVEKARRKKLYDDLAVGDLVAWLSARAEASADLVLAADVFVYLADLAPVFAGAARVLRPGGLFAFTVQSHEGRGVVLGEDRRYAHAESHLVDLAHARRLEPVIVEPASTREDRGRAVPGVLMVLAQDVERGRRLDGRPAIRRSGGADLIGWFGRVPRFHDAELLEIRLASRGPSILRIHAWRITDMIDADGFLTLDRHVVVTLTLEGVSRIDLSDFDLPGIVLHLDIEPMEGGFAIAWEGSYGVEGRLCAKSLRIDLKPGRP